MGTAGHLRFQHTNERSIAWGETTGDGKTDFSILVAGTHFFDTTIGLGNTDFFYDPS